MDLHRGADNGQGVLTASAAGYGLLELLPDSGQECIRVSADVRLDAPAANGFCTAGIYVGRSRHDGLEDPIDCFLTLGVTEKLGDTPEPSGELAFKVQFKNAQHLNNREVVPPVEYPTAEQWHTLRIELHLDEVVCYRNEKPLAFSLRPQVAETAAKVASRERAFSRAAPRFSGRDGVGLFVSSGTASFKNVRVERLPK